MSKDEQAIEKEIQSKGLNAPRLNPAHIDATIMAEQYYVFPGAAASPENFDAEIGKKISRDNARNKIWALEGYLLRSSLAA